MTTWNYQLANHFFISIHTAFAGCDTPRPWPGGKHFRFQSTQPSQAVTDMARNITSGGWISIHTAFAGCDSSSNPPQIFFDISIHTAFAGCDSKSHQFFLTNLDTLISYSTHSLQQINPSSHFLLFFRLFLLLISVRMSWGFYVRLGFARWYAFGVAFFVSRRFPELLFVSSSSSGFGSIFENAGC